MDRERALAAGVRVSLGSDVAGGPDRSMVRVARGMIETGKQVGQSKTASHWADTRCYAPEAWWQITMGNAETIGLRQTGRLEAGGWGNIVVIKPGTAWMGSIDPLAAVLYGWDDRWIEATLAGGAVGYRKDE